MTDTRTQPVAMRTVAESRMKQEGQSNAGGARRVDDGGNPYYDPAPLSDYPRMLYKQTEVERTQESADALGMKDAPNVINRFDGLLCDTCIAASLTEAEALAEMGWETSPRAAHGLADGIAKQVSAKDDEIAALRAALAEKNAGEVLNGEADRPRRGRPPGS